VEVEIVRWPDEDDYVERLRSQGVPRLLLIDADLPPPIPTDCLEDWVRLPAPEADIAARTAALRRRVERHGTRPTLDGDGILRFRDRWVGLSPVERSLAGALTERLGAVVGREPLAQRAWPGGLPTRNALDVHMLRLRRRLEPLGLEVRTVRSRGYVLQPTTTNWNGNGAH
jgi:two-component system OmpR family response regulator